MSNGNLKFIIFTITIVFVAYIIKVSWPFIGEYFALHDQNLSRREHRKELKVLNNKYGKKIIPAVILFISIFVIFGFIVGGSCC